MKTHTRQKIIQLFENLKVEMDTNTVASSLSLNKKSVHNHLKKLKSEGVLLLRKSSNTGKNAVRNIYLHNPNHLTTIANKDRQQFFERCMAQPVEMSGQFALPKTAPPMNTTYKPARNVNYIPNQRMFLTSGQAGVAGEMQ
jgi:predicted transcriptional regulator